MLYIAILNNYLIQYKKEYRNIFATYANTLSAKTNENQDVSNNVFS